MSNELSIVSNEIERAIAACLSGLAPNTRNAYSARIQKFREYALTHGGLDRATVAGWLDSLTKTGVGAQTVNQALASVKRLANEAAALGWLPYETAVQIDGLKGRKYRGVRTGNWLAAAQLKRMLEAPDRTTLAGLRDACVLSLLAGCGLRRAELCALDIDQVKDANGTMQLANVRGKGNRVRTVSVPAWAADDVRAWIAQSGLKDGKLLRSFHHEPHN